MSIIQWNCRGFEANRPDIDLFVSSRNPTLFCFQETLIKNMNTSLKQYVSYHKLAHLDAYHRPHGGVSIFIDRKFPQRPVPVITDLEAVAASVTINNITLTVCSIYISPSMHFNHRQLLDIIKQLPQPIILLGDFNSHHILWGGHSVDARGREIEQLLSATDLCLWNNKEATYMYVHPASGSRTSIDLTMCSPALFQDFTWKIGESTLGSDHYPIFIDILTPLGPDNIPRWQFHKADWDRFNTLCKTELPKYNFLNSPDPVDLFTETLISIAEQCIPKSSTYSKKPKKPWFDADCRNAIKMRNRAFNIFSRFPTETNFAIFKQLRAKARKIIKAKKKSCWKTYVSSLNANASSRKVWAIIRKINGKRTEALIPHLSIADNIITTPTDISNTLAATFAKNSSINHYTAAFISHKAKTEMELLDFNTSIQHKYNTKFSLRELQNALASCKNTSAGPDSISYELLRNLPISGQLLILSIFNQIWDTGFFPPSWRKAIVISIPKPGKDSTNPGNHRPIALTSCLCKTMERMVNNRLTWHLEHNNLLTEFQCGFRHGRSTLDHLVRLETFAREAFINRHHLVAVFFDLEKAYDTTWKYGIMKDLHAMGFRGNLPTFIHNFLRDRTFQVRLGNVLSNIYSQEMGVPQGSILSVTLFSIKINSIAKCLNSNTSCSLYVDDFLICYRSSYMSCIERQLQGCLNKLQNWCDTNGFKFSSSKTVCMHFCQQRKIHADPVLTLDKSPIPLVDQTKFLGLVFDKKLSFIPHLKYLKTKCLKAINILKVVGHYDWGADCKTMLSLYRSLIQSKLDYGSVVYGSARPSYRRMLEPIQNQSLRICLGAYRTSPAESLCVEANVAPLDIRRLQLGLQYALKLKTQLNNPAHQCTFSPLYEEKFNSRPTAISPFGIRVNLQDTGIDLDVLCQSGIPAFAPWLYTPPVIDLSLAQYKKDTTSPLFFRQLYYELRAKYYGYTAIFTDGSKIDDRVASAAVADDRLFVRRLPDRSSIYSAELTAISLAFSHISTSNYTKFIVLSDCLSCLQSFQGFKFTNPLLQDVIGQLLTLTGKNIVMAWIPGHVGIPGNELVDHMAKSALDLPYSNSKVPHTDFKGAIKSHAIKLWQNQWDNAVDNKLHSIKPVLGSNALTFRKSRREEMVLAHLRIGHTYLTHSYLLRGEPPPECISCQEPLTVQHILLHCVDFNHVRPHFFTCTNMKELFAKTDPTTVLNFVKAIGLFYKM